MAKKKDFCHICQENFSKAGHVTSECPKLICKNCQKSGHTKKKCPDILNQAIERKSFEHKDDKKALSMSITSNPLKTEEYLEEKVKEEIKLEIFEELISECDSKCVQNVISCPKCKIFKPVGSDKFCNDIKKGQMISFSFNFQEMPTNIESLQIVRIKNHKNLEIVETMTPVIAKTIVAIFKATKNIPEICSRDLEETFICVCDKNVLDVKMPYTEMTDSGCKDCENYESKKNTVHLRARDTLFVFPNTEISVELALSKDSRITKGSNIRIITCKELIKIPETKIEVRDVFNCLMVNMTIKNTSRRILSFEKNDKIGHAVKIMDSKYSPFIILKILKRYQRRDVFKCLKVTFPDDTDAYYSPYFEDSSKVSSTMTSKIKHEEANLILSSIMEILDKPKELVMIFISGYDASICLKTLLKKSNHPELKEMSIIFHILTQDEKEKIETASDINDIDLNDLKSFKVEDYLKNEIMLTEEDYSIIFIEFEAVCDNEKIEKSSKIFIQHLFMSTKSKPKPSKWEYWKTRLCDSFDYFLRQENEAFAELFHFCKKNVSRNKPILFVGQNLIFIKIILKKYAHYLKNVRLLEKPGKIYFVADKNFNGPTRKSRSMARKKELNVPLNIFEVMQIGLENLIEVGKFYHDEICFKHNSWLEKTIETTGKKEFHIPMKNSDDRQKSKSPVSKRKSVEIDDCTKKSKILKKGTFDENEKMNTDHDSGQNQITEEQLVLHDSQLIHEFDEELSCMKFENSDVLERTEDITGDDQINDDRGLEEFNKETTNKETEMHWKNIDQNLHESIVSKTYKVCLLKKQLINSVYGPLIAKIKCKEELNSYYFSVKLDETFMKSVCTVKFFFGNFLKITLKPGFFQEFKTENLQIGIAKIKNNSDSKHTVEKGDDGKDIQIIDHELDCSKTYNLVHEKSCFLKPSQEDKIDLIPENLSNQCVKNGHLIYIFDDICPLKFGQKVMVRIRNLVMIERQTVLITSLRIL